MSWPLRVFTNDIRLWGIVFTPLAELTSFSTITDNLLTHFRLA
jgi:hypothetical protein